MKPPIPKPQKKFNKYLAAGILSLAAVAILAQMPVIRVLKTVNGEHSGASYPLKEENWTHPELQKLSFNERLYRVTATGANDFEKAILLRRWAHDQWQGGDNHFYYPAWNGNEILKLAREKGNKAFCAQYAILFVQACLSIGIPARYVDLPSHFVAEVWGNNYNQWFVMDPTADIHFESDERPLNGIDLCSAYWTGKIKGIEKVNSRGERIPATKEDLESYWTYSIVTRNDHLSNPTKLVVNGADRVLKMESDYRQYPYVGRDQIFYVDDIIAWKQPGAQKTQEGKKYSEDAEDFLVGMNQSIVEMVATHKKKGQIKLKFMSVNSSSFKNFMVMRDDSFVWRDADSSILWVLKPGLNRISVRIKTTFGRLGPVSSILVFYKPPWFSFTSSGS